jgi:hypothetical protein
MAANKADDREKAKTHPALSGTPLIRGDSILAAVNPLY